MSSAVLTTPMPQLDEAIDRRAPIVLWFRVEGELHQHTSRFLGRQPTGIWIESPQIPDILIDRLIQKREQVAIAYKCGEANCRFVARVVLHDQATVTGEQQQDGLLLQREEDEPDAHRRREFRVSARESSLNIKVWRIADHVYFRDRPLASQLLKGRVLDISVGGLGLLVEAPGEPIQPGQRLRMEIKYEDVDLLMDGIVRHITPRKKGQFFRIGVEFKKLENDVVWRQSIASLTKIVGGIQRTEVRRARDAADSPPPAKALESESPSIAET